MREFSCRLPIAILGILVCAQAVQSQPIAEKPQLALGVAPPGGCPR